MRRPTLMSVHMEGFFSERACQGEVRKSLYIVDIAARKSLCT